ncbi:hypothetical protein CBM2600_B10556 [Cupriavidus taiwanensis]|nr:hypothetical protein CBM2600_B10556 [Cupriavidus taiwanensis]
MLRTVTRGVVQHLVRQAQPIAQISGHPWRQRRAPAHTGVQVVAWPNASLSWKIDLRHESRHGRSSGSANP